MQGVVLYGPPAAGKDTITTTLHRLDPRYVLFPRLKVGRGRTTGYRMTTAEELHALRERGEIIWENHRYGATYAIDRTELLQRLRIHIPVLHAGQPEAVTAITQAVPRARWIRVALWCPRDIAEHRIRARNTGDPEERLHAWDTTPPLPDADLTINTATTPPQTAAEHIHAAQHVASKTNQCRTESVVRETSRP